MELTFALISILTAIFLLKNIYSLYISPTNSAPYKDLAGDNILSFSNASEQKQQTLSTQLLVRSCAIDEITSDGLASETAIVVLKNSFKAEVGAYVQQIKKVHPNCVVAEKNRMLRDCQKYRV